MNVSRLVLLFTSYLLLCTSTALYAMNPQIRITTNLGVIDVELYADKAPQTVKNILGQFQQEPILFSFCHLNKSP